MKNIYPILFLFVFATAIQAQYDKQKSIENIRAYKEATEASTSIQAGSSSKSNSNSYGTVIGTSTYDLQSNYGVGNSRIIRYPDGTLSTVWTQSLDANGGHPDRGTGYNIYDPGTQQWGTAPTGQFGISTVRTGWPQIVELSSGELALSHDFGANHVTVNTRASRGSGIWTPSASVGFAGVWPRAVASGDTVHMITVDNDPNAQVNNITIPMEYHRSDDGGSTWSISKFSNFPDYDTNTFWFANIGADAYAIDARDNYVAIAVGGTWDPLILYKSDNYGADGSWTKTEVFRPDSAYSFLDTTSGIHIVPAVSKDMSIAIDNNGTVHLTTSGFAVRWDVGQVKPQANDQMRYYYPLLCAGLYYWNDTMQPMDYVYNEFIRDDAPALPGNTWFPVASYYDYTQDSVYNIPGSADSIGTYNGGLSGHTSISVDDNGGIFAVWSQVAETNFIIFDYFFRDIYFAYSFDNGQTWSDIVSVAAIEVGDDGVTGGSLGEEDVYPSSIKRIGSDDIMHLIFQADASAGVHVNGTAHPITTNEIVYYPLDIAPFRPLGLEDNKVISQDKTSIYPNPSRDALFVESERAIESIQIFNLIGKRLEIEILIENNSAEVNTRSLEPGIYLLNLNIRGKSETYKFVKE